MQVVRVSGTIRKAEEEAIRRARLSIVRAKRVAAGDHAAVPSSESNDFGDLLHGDDDLRMANGIEDVDEPGDVDDESD